MEELRKKGAEIQAIQIGRKDEQAEKTFRNVFADHGTVLQDRIGQLPETLMRTITWEMESAFQR